MEYKKSFYLILIFTSLLLIFFALVSLQFLTGQNNRIKEIDPRTMVQYETVLEVDKFLKINKQLQQANNP